MSVARRQVVICSSVGPARGVDAAAAAVGVAATALEGDDAGSLLLDLRRAPRTPRGALLASGSARALEAGCADVPSLRGAARGRLCFAAPAAETVERLDVLRAVLDDADGPSLLLCVCEPADFRLALAAAAPERPAALLRALPRAHHSLQALISRELRAEAIPLKIWSAPIGPIPARRALAGLEPGGESGRRAARIAGALAPASRWVPSPQGLPALRSERAQALPAVLGIAVLVVVLALILAAFGGAAAAKGRLQRSVDLAALSAARSMRDDFPRLFLPAQLPNGLPNPAHLERADYLRRAEAAGLDAARRNGTDDELVAISFPDAASMAPLRVQASVHGRIELEGRAQAPSGSTTVRARAEIALSAAVALGSQPPLATGGGYAGPLAYRQGEGMRPDVAAAFNRLAAAAAADGVSLVVNSGFRSDAEQQQLWDANPDPRMVAPPGTSLHRCGTELDLGPPGAYAWLARSASRFEFTQRYSWEPWHFGFDGGPAPCSAEGDRASGGDEADGRTAAGGGLPAFVPERFREVLLEAAARHGVSAALLAAQIMAESNFNPNATSPVGAQGIAQFMPATAQAYGLRDPFDPEASIDAQATMMGELVSRFGSIELALAAYNAGPGAVAGCTCVPPYPETQAYVAGILGLLGGAGALGALGAPALEVRLIA